MLAGKIATLLIIATVLSLISALIVASRYRAAMKRLMKMPLTAASPPPAALPSAMDASPFAVSLDDNDLAYRHLIGAFVGLTVVMALTRTLITQMVADGPITLLTISALGAAYSWPVVPVIAVLGRWRRRQLVGALVLWFVAAVALMSWRTTEAVSFAQVFSWMLIDIGLPPGSFLACAKSRPSAALATM